MERHDMKNHAKKALLKLRISKSKKIVFLVAIPFVAMTKRLSLFYGRTFVEVEPFSSTTKKSTTSFSALLVPKTSFENNEQKERENSNGVENENYAVDPQLRNLPECARGLVIPLSRLKKSLPQISSESSLASLKNAHNIIKGKNIQPCDFAFIIRDDIWLFPTLECAEHFVFSVIATSTNESTAVGKFDAIFRKNNVHSITIYNLPIFSFPLVDNKEDSISLGSTVVFDHFKDFADIEYKDRIDHFDGSNNTNNKNNKGGSAKKRRGLEQEPNQRMKEQKSALAMVKFARSNSDDFAMAAPNLRMFLNYRRVTTGGRNDGYDGQSSDRGTSNDGRGSRNKDATKMMFGLKCAGGMKKVPILSVFDTSFDVPCSSTFDENVTPPSLSSASSPSGEIRRSEGAVASTLCSSSTIFTDDERNRISVKTIDVETTSRTGIANTTTGNLDVDLKVLGYMFWKDTDNFDSLAVLARDKNDRPDNMSNITGNMVFDRWFARKRKKKDLLNEIKQLSTKYLGDKTKSQRKGDKTFILSVVTTPGVDSGLGALLQAEDPKNGRKASCLASYFKLWSTQNPFSGEAFFDWLDYGSGKLKSRESCSREKLNRHHVTFFDEQERQDSQVQLRLVKRSRNGSMDGTAGYKVRIAYKSSSKPVRSGKYEFVWGLDKELYVAKRKFGVTSHATFFRAGPVLMAGEMTVGSDNGGSENEENGDGGRLLSINPLSGHYKPRTKHIKNLYQFLNAQWERQNGGFGHEDVDYDHGGNTNGDAKLELRGVAKNALHWKRNKHFTKQEWSLIFAATGEKKGGKKEEDDDKDD